MSENETDERTAVDRMVMRLRQRPWCYDEAGQSFEYVDAETADEAAAVLESLVLQIQKLEYMVELNAAKVTAQAKTLDWMRDAIRESCRDDRSQVLGGCPLLHKDA